MIELAGTLRMRRSSLITDLVSRVLDIECSHPVRVGIDGVDASGKTTLADELAPHIEASGRQVVRGSIDRFHHPTSVRYRRGRESPEGYYLDSFDHASLVDRLLRPLGPGGDRRFRRAAFDYRNDTPVDPPLETAQVDAVLLFDGVFLHCRKLRPYWDFSVFLEVDFAVAARRAERRERSTPCDQIRLLYANRYTPGQRLYLEAERPRSAASLVIDNSDLENPTIVRAV